MERPEPTRSQDMAGPLTSAAAKRMKWIKQRPQLPGWWGLLQITLGVLFFFYLAYSAVTSGHHESATASGRDLGHGVVAPVGGPGGPARTQPLPTDAGDPASALPTDEQAPGTPAPVTGDPIPTAPADLAGSGYGGDTVTLLDQAGNTVAVPTSAADVARRAMLGTFDPTALQGLPLARGFTPARPVQTYPSPIAGPLTVVTHTATRITFTAKVDPDGTQRFLTGVQATVASQDGSWVYTGAAG
jgi:hypothetical protein